MTGLPSGSNAPSGRAAPRRRAVRAGRRPPAGTLLVVLVVGLTGALLAGVEHIRAPAVPSERGDRVPVDALTQVCLSGDSDRADERMSTVAPPADPVAAPADGRLVVGALGGRDKTVDARRGLLLEVPAEPPATILRASGAAAAGRLTFLTRDGAAGGGAVQECLPPRAEWWFTGAGAGLDHRSRLVLANVDEGPATVDVRIYGADGRVDSVGTRGMTVPPGETRTVAMLDVAPRTGVGADDLAVHVATTRGRVAAALSDSFAGTAGVRPGAAWLPAQERAARRLRLGPLPVRAGSRTLLLANPTEREALVDLSVSGASGAFAPTETSSVRVPASSVVAADVGAAFAGDAATLRLTSNVRVAASVRSTSRRGGSELVTYAAVLEPVTGPAAVLAVPGGALHLAAGPAGAEAAVVAHARDGSQVASTRIDVPAGATVAWPLPRRSAYLTVDPLRGHPRGGVVAPADEGYAQSTLRPLVLELRRPAVVPAVPPRVGQSGSTP
jgi:hypothetical protein